MIRPKSLLSLVGLLVLLLASCSPDCEWDAIVRTWVDQNENGLWDEDEAPLLDVRCFVESSYLAALEPAVTDQWGEAHLNGMLAGCPNDAVFFVYALPPPGYRPSLGTLYPTQESAERVFELGFVPDEEYQ